LFTNKKYGVAQQLIVVSKPLPDKMVKFPKLKLKITELRGPLFKLNFVGACVAAVLVPQRHVLGDISLGLLFKLLVFARRFFNTTKTTTTTTTTTPTTKTLA
jgi:hypothetical protein